MALVRLYQPVRPLVMVSRSSRIPLTTLAPDQLLRSSSKPPKSSYATFAGAAQKAANWLWSKDKSTRAHDQAGVGPERCAPTTSHRDVAHCRERRTLSISGGAQRRPLHAVVRRHLYLTRATGHHRSSARSADQGMMNGQTAAIAANETVMPHGMAAYSRRSIRGAA